MAEVSDPKNTNNTLLLKDFGILTNGDTNPNSDPNRPGHLT